MRLDTQAKLLAFAAVVEAGTGIALVIDPALVVNLLLGTEVAAVGIVLARCFGIALVAQSVACWPAVQRAGGGSPAFRAMLIAGDCPSQIGRAVIAPGPSVSCAATPPRTGTTRMG